LGKPAPEGRQGLGLLSGGGETPSEEVKVKLWHVQMTTRFTITYPKKNNGTEKDE